MRKTEQVYRGFTALRSEAVRIADQAIQAALFFAFVLWCQALFGKCWTRVLKCQALPAQKPTLIRHSVSRSFYGRAF